MKFFFDTEFIERPSTIELLSIGIVAEDGRALYLENEEADTSQADDWIRQHVLANLVGGITQATRAEIKQAILAFVGNTTHDPPEFWAYYAAYDWVVFCWLFGRMIDLPKGYPKYCKDFKQYLDDRMIPKKALPKQSGVKHNALEDAKWLAQAYKKVTSG